MIPSISCRHLADWCESLGAADYIFIFIKFIKNNNLQKGENSIVYTLMYQETRTDLLCSQFQPILLLWYNLSQEWTSRRNWSPNHCKALTLLHSNIWTQFTIWCRHFVCWILKTLLLHDMIFNTFMSCRLPTWHVFATYWSNANCTLIYYTQIETIKNKFICILFVIESFHFNT